MILNRKRVSKEQKFSILREHFDKGTPISELARVNGIHPITIYQWKRLMGEESEKKLNLEELLLENEKLKKDNNHLTKALGKAHSDLELGKEIIEFLKKKAREEQLQKQKSSFKK